MKQTSINKEGDQYILFMNKRYKNMLLLKLSLSHSTRRRHIHSEWNHRRCRETEQRSAEDVETEAEPRGCQTS